MYCILGLFMGENFHEYHESTAIYENFAFEMLTESVEIGQFVKNFPRK